MRKSANFTACSLCGAFIKISVDGVTEPELDNADLHRQWHEELWRERLAAMERADGE